MYATEHSATVTYNAGGGRSGGKSKELRQDRKINE